MSQDAQIPSLPPTADQPKTAFRAWARGRLKLLTPEVERLGSEKACERAIEALSERLAAGATECHLLAYVPIRGEIDPIMALTAAIKRDMPLAVPRCATRESHPALEELPRAAVEGGAWLASEFEDDAWGCRAPRGHRPVRNSSIAIALIPGLVFDREGHRLGRGAGIYDRLLSDLPPNALRIGLVHADRVVPRLPREAHDIPMHMVITPDEVITAAK